MLNKICYLVIDDTEERALLDTAIGETELGYERIADKSLERAEERFSREPEFHPSYIFIDWNLPLLKYIKSFAHLVDVPVIIYTAEINAEEIEEAKQAGAAHCVLKTTHETALTSLLLELFKNGDSRFVLTYPVGEQRRGNLK